MKQTRNDGFRMNWPKGDEWSGSERDQSLANNNASDNIPELTKPGVNGRLFHARFIEIVIFPPKDEFCRPCQSL